MLLSISSSSFRSLAPSTSTSRAVRGDCDDSRLISKRCAPVPIKSVSSMSVRGLEEVPESGAMSVTVLGASGLEVPGSHAEPR